MKLVSITGNEKELTVGSRVFFGGIRGRGGHGAHAIITKMNKKTFLATEVKGSYVPGMKWRIGYNTPFALDEGEPGPTFRRYWFNDN